MGLGRRHWTLALLVAGGLHAAVALALFWPQAEPGAEAPGIGGIEIALGPIGGAPGGEATPDVEPLPEVPEPAPVEEAVAPEPEPESELEPEIEPEPQPEPEPEPEAEPDPEPIEPLAETVVATPPPRRARAVEPPPRTTAGAAGKAGAANRQDAGTLADDASAGGMAGAKADYATLVLAWLERHKEYPASAQRRRQEGVVMLYIAIDRDGQVLEARLDKGSGHALLDAAALAMVERAAPLPPMPDDLPQNRLEMIVPVQFFIR